MKLTGSYKINLEKQKVWDALNDPEVLKQAIPGCEEFNKKSDTEFEAIKGSLTEEVSAELEKAVTTMELNRADFSGLG